MIEDVIRSQIRRPEATYEALKRQAKLNRRSLNREMVVRLQTSLNEHEETLTKLAVLEKQKQEMLQLLKYKF
jgi:hypothetical protein